MGESKTKNLTALLAFEGFEKDLEAEIRRQGAHVEIAQGRLFLASRVSRRPVWAQVMGIEAEILPYSSISDAAKILKSNGKRWACASEELHRRSLLIQEQVFRFKEKTLGFLAPAPTDEWGLWALLDAGRMVIARKTDSSLPLGKAVFTETDEPPSRAYTKLWELFTLHDVRPPKGARVIDMGGSPGGWTWVLAQVGCQVLSVDKAPLDPKIAKLSNVRTLKKDAFKLPPSEAGQIDWFFSDLICYPARLWELVEEWRAAGVRNFVCTIKFQGETDFAVMEKFAAVTGSKILHLCANKHEVTWVSLAEAK